MRLPFLVAERENFGSKAPITEALIDIRIAPGSVDIAALETLGALIGDFPKVLAQHEFEAEFSLQGSLSTKGTVGVRGYVFLNEDRKRAVQARRDGFSYSRFHGYTCWTDLRDEAHEAWRQYVGVVNPEKTIRAGVRYINRIPLPPGPLKFEEWFEIYPRFPAELGPLVGFQQHLALTHPHAPDYRAKIIFGVAPPDGSSIVSVIYDIHAWQDAVIPVDSEQIWEVLENLREYKNDLFFGFMGPKLKESLK